MDRLKIRQLVTLVTRAQRIGTSLGIHNILQPGLVKEMVIANILNHNLIHSKRDSDASDRDDANLKFEYLSCYQGGSGQFDRMFKHPPKSRAESLKRISRNSKVYFAVFCKTEPLKVLSIYEIEPEVMVNETERQLDRSKNDISHVGFNERWARSNGLLVYPSTQDVQE